MDLITFSSVFLIGLGFAVGSFLNVLIDRLPRGEDVISRGSACRSCARPLTPGELIPVLSFVVQNGQCRTCRSPIPPWHLYIEIAAPGLALLVVLVGGPVGVIWLTTAVLWLLLALGATDLVWFRLPDPLTGGLLIAALGLAAADPGRDIAIALASGAIAAIAFWLIRWIYGVVRKREGLGLGDVKLMAGIGAFNGPQETLHAILIAATLALSVALIRSAALGTPLSATSRVPFGAALCLGSGLAWFLGVSAF